MYFTLRLKYLMSWHAITIIYRGEICSQYLWILLTEQGKREADSKYRFIPIWGTVEFPKMFIYMWLKLIIDAYFICIMFLYVYYYIYIYMFGYIFIAIFPGFQPAFQTPPRSNRSTLTEIAEAMRNRWAMAPRHDMRPHTTHFPQMVVLVRGISYFRERNLGWWCFFSCGQIYVSWCKCTWQWNSAC